MTLTVDPVTNRVSTPRAVCVGDIAAIGAWSFGYDGENRMVGSTLSGTTTSYSYDGEGRRVQKTTGSAATNFVYDAQGQLAAEDSTQLAPVHGTEYLTADHLGSTRMTTDASGTPLALHDYVPFGDEIPAAVDSRGSLYGAADGVNKKFTGQYRDPETANSAMPSGLDYFGARYFSAAQGRFTTPDLPLLDQHPENPQSWNLYAYVRNNPLRLTDPTGESAVDEAEQEYLARQSTARENGAKDKGGSANSKGSEQRKKIDTDKVVDYMDKHAFGTNQFGGKCAGKCHEGLAAGGLPWDKDRPSPAKDNGPWLMAHGAKRVAQSDESSLPEGYDPRKGDIAIFQGGEKRNTSGHMQIYNGKQWVSDTFQRTFSPRQGYEGGVSIYRFQE
jgi:RHS repeat-associated protein